MEDTPDLDTNFFEWFATSPLDSDEDSPHACMNFFSDERAVAVSPTTTDANRFAKRMINVGFV